MDEVGGLNGAKSGYRVPPSALSPLTQAASTTTRLVVQLNRKAARQASLPVPVCLFVRPTA